MHEPHERYDNIFPATLIFSLGLVIFGFFMDTPQNIVQGLYHIIAMQDMLITDYVQTAGIGAALVNAGIVTAISVLLLKLEKEPFNGFSVVVVGMMSGFSLFGKNFINIWPILLGTWLYARYQGDPFAKHAPVALLSTALAPLVSYMALGSRYASFPIGLLTGIIIGFTLPALSSYTYKVQNGMNLYNMGFACGLFGLMVVPILTAFGDKPDAVLYWATAYNLPFALALIVLCLIFILFGLFACKCPAWAVWAGYRRLLMSTGRPPSDYLRMFGAGPVMINIGVNGLLGMLYILLIGGELNGPTVGGILVIMGFSATGKHAFNMIPIMVGVLLGALGNHHAVNAPAMQMAGLFGTGLAPIAGHFGWPFGLLAGFIHSSLVLQTGGPMSGMNLYNNGFSAGLIAISLYPIITAIVKHRRPTLTDQDYYDLFEETAPIHVTTLEKHQDVIPTEEPLFEGIAQKQQKQAAKDTDEDALPCEQQDTEQDEK